MLEATDALLDDIDDILEENAETFIDAFFCANPDNGYGVIVSKTGKNIIGTEMEWAVMGRLRDPGYTNRLMAMVVCPASSEILKPGNLPDGN